MYKRQVYASLSLVSERNHYVRPKLNEKGVIDIKDGRHPVVEQMITNDMFIANDTYLDNGSHCISIITGPNMAGKSTYMRQTALIVLMAQIGCCLLYTSMAVSAGLLQEDSPFTDCSTCLLYTSKGVSSFSSLTTELAATIGTGNIVGVALSLIHI